MKISIAQKEKLENLYQSLLVDPKILAMKEIPMHRGSNCYEHVFKVAKKAVNLAVKFKHINYEVVLLAAVLHDYYLYDWRTDKSKRRHHGQNHPFVAAENAARDFHISEAVREIIISHMWPIDIKYFPKTKEAKIVSFADKRVATVEALTSIKYKSKRREKYLSYIAKLFDE